MENPGLHSGGEAIGSESIEFLIECKMVLASSRFTTTKASLSNVDCVLPPSVRARKTRSALLGFAYSLVDAG